MRLPLRERARATPGDGSSAHRRVPGGRLPVYLLLVALALVGSDAHVPVLRAAAGFVMLLGVPTLLVYRRARFGGEDAPHRLLYSFGLALLGALVGGLVLDVALPLVSIDRPLSPGVLGVASFVVDLALLRWCTRVTSVVPPGWFGSVRRTLVAPVEPAQGLAAVAVVVAVLGAIRLNNDAGGALALLARILAVLAVLVLLWRRRTSAAQDVRALALVATSLLLSTSLRGWSVTGHDIQSEYFAFLLTDVHQRWQMSAFQNAYNACLSINILPSVLSQTTGISGTALFKVVMQLVFALVPGLTYLLSRRFLSRRLAVVASVLTMAFPTFAVDMPYLVRQEVAFFFLALLVLAATAPSHAHDRSMRALVAAFGVGVVLSHYSTTYMMLIGLVLGLVFLLIWQLAHRRLPSRVPDRRRGAALGVLSPGLIGFLLVASLLWTGPATHTGGHASQVARATVSALTGHGGEGPGASDLSYSILGGGGPSTRQRLDLYVKQTLATRAASPAASLLLTDLGSAELKPTIVPAPTVPRAAFGRLLAHVGIDPSTWNGRLRTACAALLQLFIVVGLFGAVFRRRAATRFPWAVTCLCVGTLGALGAIVVVPGLSAQYGVLRAFQQLLLVLAPVMAVGLAVLVRPVARVVSRWSEIGLVVTVTAGILLVLSGIVPSAIGAFDPPLALRNAGSYYDRYYVPDSAQRAVTWLTGTAAAEPKPPSIVSGADVEARLRQSGLLSERIDNALYPTLLPRDAYVVLGPQTVRTGRASVFYSGDQITYDYPVQDLDRTLDIVYSGPTTRIYR